MCGGFLNIIFSSSLKLAVLKQGFQTLFIRQPKYFDLNVSERLWHLGDEMHIALLHQPWSVIAWVLHILSNDQITKVISSFRHNSINEKQVFKSRTIFYNQWTIHSVSNN